MASAAAFLKGRALELSQYLGIRKLLRPWDTTGATAQMSCWGRVTSGKGGQGTDLERSCSAEPCSAALQWHPDGPPFNLNIGMRTSGWKPGLGKVVFREAHMQPRAPRLELRMDGVEKSFDLNFRQPRWERLTHFSYLHQSQTLIFALGRISDSHSDRKAWKGNESY